MVSGRPLSEICRDLARTASEAQHDNLAQLLRMASLQAAETGLRQTVSESPIEDMLVGVWDWDIVNDRVYTDGRFASLFSVDADQAAGGMPLSVWLDAIHPDDLDAVTADIRQALRGKLFSREYRVVSPTGIHWVYARGKCTMDKTGQPVRFPGAIVDITYEKLDHHDLSIAPL